ncbi:MAG TPA: hypothetical protein VLH94_03085 [Spirochaetia bacterium]|nr:hypothetical protein [Spirochaetia bacterium]
MKKTLLFTVLVVVLGGCASTVPAMVPTTVPPTQTEIVPTATAVPPTATTVPTATVEPTPDLLELAVVFPTDSSKYKEELPQITEEDISSGLWQKSVDTLNASSSSDIITADWQAAKLVGVKTKEIMYAIGIFASDRKALYGAYTPEEKFLHWPVQPQKGFAWIESYHGRGDVIVFPARFYNKDGSSVSAPIMEDAELWLSGYKDFWNLYIKPAFLLEGNTGRTSVVLGYAENGIDTFGQTAVGLEDVKKWEAVMAKVKESNKIPSEAGLVGWPYFADRMK